MDSVAVMAVGSAAPTLGAMTRNRSVVRGPALALLGLASLLAAGPAHANRPKRPVLAVGNSYAGTVTFIDARALRKLGQPLNAVVPDAALEAGRFLR